MTIFKENKKITWESHNEGLAYMGGCASKDILVVVGKSGLVTISRDGKNWKTIPQFTKYSFLDCAYSPQLDLFVAVGQGGMVYSSKDAEKWTKVIDCIPGQTNWQGICWGPLGFAAVGPGGVLLTSATGTNWQKSVITTNGTGTFIECFNGLYVACWTLNRIQISKDLKKWKCITLEDKISVKDADNMLGLAWNSKKICLGGAHGATYMFDPVTEEVEKIPECTSNYLYHIVWDGKNFVACGNSDADIKAGSMILIGDETGKNWYQEYAPIKYNSNGSRCYSSLFVNIVFKGAVYCFGARGEIIRREI